MHSDDALSFVLLSMDRIGLFFKKKKILNLHLHLLKFSNSDWSDNYNYIGSFLLILIKSKIL